MQPYIVGLGEALWDVLPEGKKIGGAPANFAYHVSQFGYNSLAVSAVGNDTLGTELLDALDAHGLHVLIPRLDLPTGTVGVQIDAQGIPTYDIREGVAWDNIPFTPELETVARATRAVCFGSLAQRNAVSRNTIRKFLAATPADSMKIFDINLRQQFYTKEVVAESLTACNVLKINDEELVIVARLFDLPTTGVEDQCRRLIAAHDLDLLVLTCGVEGSHVFASDGTSSFLPTPKVVVADTVGAGDSFTAAFTASLLAGRSLTEAHRRAVEVSAFVCTQPGAMPELPGELRTF